MGLWPIIQQTPFDGWKTYWSYEPDEKAIALGMKARNKIWLSVLEVPFLSEGDLTAEFENRSTELTLFDTEKRRIDEVEYSMSGHYKCFVESNPEGLKQHKFITNSIKLNVISPPTLNERVSHIPKKCLLMVLGRNLFLFLVHPLVLSKLEGDYRLAGRSCGCGNCLYDFGQDKSQTNSQSENLGG